jgi:Tol biopolymer transport system component
MKRLGCLLLLLLCCIFSSPETHAGIAETYGISPFWQFKQIETEHFRITFPKQLSDTAQAVANNLEDANAVLSKKLYWQPSYKARILLIDNTDSANGVTTPVEDFGIILYVTPPDNWYSTSYYDDWLRLLCFHEYTHFVNIDTTRGLWKIGRVLFGDVLLPNAAWPNWMLEGLAVYMETASTHAGRGRSTYYDMILRSAVDAGVLNTSKFFTLDRFNSLTVPYFPAGESVYLFGYEMMKELAKNTPPGETADQGGPLKGGIDTLGVMSYRSADRIPYFINANLDNITGRDWYSYWDQFVRETKVRSSKQIAVIRSQPVTSPQFVTHNGFQVLGSTFSPDGQWVAYTKQTLDELNGIYLRDLKTGKEKWLAEKIEGTEASFTPDSKFLMFSSLRREAEYYEYSELGVYSLESGSTRWITDKVRARDPNISLDGKSVVFTVTHGPKVDLAVAHLTESNGELNCDSMKTIYSAQNFDVASTPKFSPDGKNVFFSLHKNGKVSEELMSLDLGSGKARALVENGSFNRFPAVSSHGDLYFVSNLTGVDNLYQYREGQTPKLITNLTTGVWFPSISSDNKIYGAVFSYHGSDLAQLDPLPSDVSPQAVTVAPPEAPQTDPQTDIKSSKHYEIEDYSLTPSIWPRAWIPYLAVSPGNLSLGESVSGFDSTDRHRYLLNLGYDTLSSSADWLAEYQNRSLGVTFTLVAQNQLSFTEYSGNSLYSYTRDFVLSAGISYPFFWTYSSLTPSITFNLDKTSYYYPGADTASVNYDYKTGLLPTIDGILSYTDAESTPLAISPEEGRNTILGARYYASDADQLQTVKSLVSDQEFLRLGSSHWVLVPSVQGSYSSADPSTNTNINSDVVLQGRYPIITGSFVNTSLTSLPIRGYPGQTFYVKAAEVSALDLRFPITDIFRGWGTNPIYLDQIYGFVFGESTYLPFNHTKMLPSAGGGLVANLQVFLQIPVAVTAQFHQGFRTSAGGAGEFFGTAEYTGLQF